MAEQEQQQQQQEQLDGPRFQQHPIHFFRDNYYNDRTESIWTVEIRDWQPVLCFVFQGTLIRSNDGYHITATATPYDNAIFSDRLFRPIPCEIDGFDRWNPSWSASWIFRGERFLVTATNFPYEQ